MGGAAQIGLYNCYAFQPKTCVCAYVTGSSLGVTIIGFQLNSNVSGSTGLKIDAGSVATVLDSDFSTANTPLTNAGTYKNLNAGISTTITTGTLVGKTITVTAGQITNFA